MINPPGLWMYSNYIHEPGPSQAEVLKDFLQIPQLLRRKVSQTSACSEIQRSPKFACCSFSQKPKSNHCHEMNSLAVFPRLSQRRLGASIAILCLTFWSCTAPVGGPNCAAASGDAGEEDPGSPRPTIIGLRVPPRASEPRPHPLDPTSRPGLQAPPPRPGCTWMKTKSHVTGPALRPSWRLPVGRDPGRQWLLASGRAR